MIVTGKLTQRSYEDRNGAKRTVLELTVDEIGVSLKYAVAKPIKRSALTGARASGQTVVKATAARGSDDPFAEFQPEPEEA